MSSTTTHTLAAAAGATVLLMLAAIARLVERFGAGQVLAASFWLFLTGAVIAGLVSTASDRRHGRGEWAEVDQWNELDNTLRGDR